MTGRQWWTPAQLAEDWGETRETIYGLIRRRRLRAQKLGRGYRIHATAKAEFEHGATDPDGMRHPGSRDVA